MADFPHRSCICAYGLRRSVFGLPLSRVHQDFRSNMCTVASLLKFFTRDARNAAPDTIVARTLMRVAGWDGDSDDAYILRLWSEIAGPGGVDSLKFHVSRRNHKKRLRRFHLGKGSKTLHHYVVKLRLRRASRPQFNAKLVRRALVLRAGQTPSLTVWRKNAWQKRHTAKTRM